MTQHTTGLAHDLLPRHVAMISLGGIIGAGLFVGSSAAIAMAGPAVLISYALSGLLVFLIMRMLGEMAVARPGLGSFAEYAALSLGHWAGFVTGWLYWYFWVITVGVETIAGAKLLHAWIAAPIWLIGTVLIAVMTATNLFSVRTYAEFEFWFASLKVGAIMAFIVVGLAYIFGFAPGTALTVLTSHGGLFPRGVGAAFAAIPVVIFSMMGSEVATIAAAETADPATNVARAGRTVSLRILVFYVLSIAVIVSVLPWDSVEVGSSPFARALATMHIPGAALAMNVVVITAVLSCLNSGLYITSRMLYELARRGDAPAIFAAVSARRVPSLGILFGTAGGLLAALASIISPDLVFMFLINTSGAIILFIYLVIALAQIRLRQKLQARGETIALKMWLFPALSMAVIAGIALVLASMAFAPDQRIQLALSALSLGVILLAFALRRRLGALPSIASA